MGPLLDAFPNIRHLHLQYNEDYDFLSAERMETIRQTSFDAQIMHSSRWPSLAFYSGDVPSLYMLALQCHIAHVDILLNEKLEYFHVALQAAMPERLTLTLVRIRRTRGG